MTKPRVYVIGMHSRNHAQLNTQFSDRLDIQFYTGNQKTPTPKAREGDHVFIAVDFCSHLICNRFTDDAKKRGLKKKLVLVNGGMTAMSVALRELIERLPR